VSKVLWLGDAGCTTGFGRVSHSIAERLVLEYGHEVHVLAINHRGDDYPSLLQPHRKTPLWLYRPDTYLGGDMYGYSRVMELLGKVEPEVVVLFNDAPVLIQMLFANQYDPQRTLLQYRPLLSYIPVDGYQQPAEWSELLSKVTHVVAMSKFGQAAYPGSELVYHGVDSDLFWPISEHPITVSSGEVLKTKRQCKKAFGFDPKGFLVLRVDKNSGRKDFAATYEALVPVMLRNPDIQVHFHCSNAGDGATDLNILFRREPRIDRARFFMPGQHQTFTGWPQQDLNALYNAADVFVTTSRGEGFGLTIAEALACGVPVIAQDVSAIPEVVGPGGMLIRPQRPLTVPAGQQVWLADIEAFSGAIEHLHASAGARRSFGEAGVAHVRQSFRWDDAAERFDRYITALAAATAETETEAPPDEHDRAEPGPDRPGDRPDEPAHAGGPIAPAEPEGTGPPATDPVQGPYRTPEGVPIH
jgi:glycosyltransferase involved in cell wall biosynthesis